MLYREIGKTGRQAGIIGLGCEHLEGKSYEEVYAVIRAALDEGINIFDVFMPGKVVRENIAKALGNSRKDVMIQAHIGSTDVNQQFDICRDVPTVQRFFEDALRIYGPIEFGMMFFIDSEKDYEGVFNTGFADYVLKLKQSGDIAHIGFSSHQPGMARRVIETGLPEMMLYSLNLAFDLHPIEMDALEGLAGTMDAAAFRGLDPERAALYRLCEQKGVGITVMKALGAGKLLSPEHSPFATPMTEAQCIHYALTRPAVASVLVGCKTAQEVKDSVKYLTASDEERDYAPLLGTLRNDFRGKCVYCSHCQPCPSQIDIASVNKYLDIAKLDEANVPPSIRQHYGALDNKGDACVKCGNCEERCPFGVPVMENMDSAVKLFG